MYPRLDKNLMYPRLVLPVKLHPQLFTRLPFLAAMESLTADCLEALYLCLTLSAMPGFWFNNEL